MGPATATTTLIVNCYPSCCVEIAVNFAPCNFCYDIYIYLYITKLQAFSLSLVLLSSDRSDRRGGGSGATRGEKKIERRKLVERRRGAAAGRIVHPLKQQTNQLTSEQLTNERTNELTERSNKRTNP